MDAINKTEIIAYQEALGQLSAKGTPWVPSEQDRALEKAFYCNRIKIDTIVRGKMYLVMDGLTIYRGMQQGTYYQRGSLVVFSEGAAEDGFIPAYIIGDTFRVLANSGFANESALFTSQHAAFSGHVDPDRLSLVELADATAIILTFVKSKQELKSIGMYPLD